VVAAADFQVVVAAAVVAVAGDAGTTITRVDCRSIYR
jgi:hypothetical protein